jgi:hypothetical protein
MYKLPNEELRRALAIGTSAERIDQGQAVRLKTLMAQEFREQGELNVEVTDKDDTRKLEGWFQDRWEDRFCLDISHELAEIIDESWAGRSLSPYYVYLKMAYHLSQEARDGLSNYQTPANFGLLPFQEAAVKIAAQHINKRGGVIVGDVVGLGKTLVGTALAHLCEEEYGTSTLIICPKNLVRMWQRYIDTYGLRGRVVSISQVDRVLPEIPARFRLVLIDESHNLRNRTGSRYQAIKDYIEQSGSRCILLTATPYNKTYLDISAQLQLFLKPEGDLGIKPEAYIRSLGGEIQFRRRHSTSPVRSLLAFEHSTEPEDWQQLMSQYMVRRTRSFIKNTYAKLDGDRYYLEFADGTRSYFPNRHPRTVKFKIEDPQTDPYARLYDTSVVTIINRLNLPRYGLGNYIELRPAIDPTTEEAQQLANLSNAGQRLMGFCRTNLFKRLESSGIAFIQSIERHILRNYVFLWAIEHGLPLPIGTQDAELLDGSGSDEDDSSLLNLDWETTDEDATTDDTESGIHRDFQLRSQQIYQLYQNRYPRRFKWIRSTLFADTARYLHQALTAKGLERIGLATGQSPDPTALAWQFSPRSNDKPILPQDELRILIATDVLSEGQNLQDCAVILNYDEQSKTIAGTLGNKRSAAARTYDRLLAYTQQVRTELPLLARGTEWESLERAIEEINQYPLRPNAIARLNREFKASIKDEALAKLVVFLREHDALCIIDKETDWRTAQIICSLGLFSTPD